MANRVKTTGIKGTSDNVTGVRVCIQGALDKANLKVSDIDLIKINEASPVIGESAMETISETIITDSAMIGHNPDTPGGIGIAFGETIKLETLGGKYCGQDYISSWNNVDKYKYLPDCRDCDCANGQLDVSNKEYIVIIDENFNYDSSSKLINHLVEKGINITGAILKEDEAVLLNNRLNKKMPVIDEVKMIEKVPVGRNAAIEVAEAGMTLKVLCNPYGIAGIFGLNSEETKKITPIAKGLIGLRSGVVIRTPSGEVREQKVKAGKLKIIGDKSIEEVDINSGAYNIMRKLSQVGEVKDIEGERSTNISFMIKSIKDSMAKLTGLNMEKVKIKDLLAIDTTVPLEIKGGIAGESYREKAVAIAAMVKTEKLPLMKIKEELENYFKVKVEVNGVEAVMASIGALTTRGTKLPIAIVDMGGGSTDVALLDEKGIVKTIHLAGAGELVTMLINLELGLNDRNLAEEVKKNIVGKVESLYTLRLESGEVRFYDKPLNSKLYGRVVVVKEDELLPIYSDVTVERIIKVRRRAKEEIFIKNIIRGLKAVSDMENLYSIPNVVLVGGSALDFEVPNMVSLELSNYGIIAGSGNIRNTEGPRHAVSTGLVLDWLASIR